MSTHPTTTDIAMRLALTMLAGFLIGINRSERGRPAGMRTAMLVCLASSLSMIMANVLLPTSGKAWDGFVNIDPMRLPLGVLSGMGFIGAGAIIRRENMVLGITTAATLWFVTVLGLSFGAGLFALGLTVLALSMAVLWGLEYAEEHMTQDRTATLMLTVQARGPGEDDIRERLRPAGYKIIGWQITYNTDEHEREFCCDVQWRGHPTGTHLPPFLAELAQLPGVKSVQWKPLSTGKH